MFQDGLHVALRPFGQLEDEGDEAFAGGREGILHAGRHLGIDGAAHQPVGLQHREGGGQDLGRDVGYQFLQLIEARGTVFAQQHDEQEGPLVAEAGHHVADGAYLDERIFFQVFCHANVLSFCKSYLEVTMLHRGNLLLMNK